MTWNLPQVVVELNIYDKDPDNGFVDRLFVKVPPEKLAVSQAKTPGAPLVFTASLDNREIFQKGLPFGAYRAEAIVSLVDMRSPLVVGFPGPQPPQRLIEAGGSALEFVVNQLFSSSVSDTSGEILVTPRLIIRNPKLANAAIAASQKIVDNQLVDIRKWVAQANSPLAGFPEKKNLVATETALGNTPVKGTTFKFQGQVFGDTPGLLESLNGIVAKGNKSFSVPGGDLILSTKSSLTLKSP